MIVGNDYLFIQVPRTSSSSMTQVLLREGGKETSIHQAMVDPGRPCVTNRFVFGFVRNPWDREYSQWTYHTTKDDFIIRPTFEEWVLWRYSDLKLESSKYFRRERSAEYLKTFSVQPQLGFLMDRDGDLQTNFIGRFETRAEDTTFVLNRLGIEVDEYPHYEGSWFKDQEKTYRDFYTAEMKELIESRMLPDIEVFNYVFEQSGCLERKANLALLTNYDFLEQNSNYLHA